MVEELGVTAITYLRASFCKCCSFLLSPADLHSKTFWIQVPNSQLNKLGKAHCVARESNLIVCAPLGSAAVVLMASCLMAVSSPVTSGQGSTRSVS